MKRFTGHAEDWGAFMDVKEWPAIINPRKYAGQRVIVGTVTDGCNPLEEKFGETRLLLEQMKDSGTDILICTKSDLVPRDMDLLREINQKSPFTVSWSVNTPDEDFKNDMDAAVSIERRLAAMKQVCDAGIRTVCFISPVFPGLTDMEAIFERAKDQCDLVWLENLNLRGGFKKIIMIALGKSILNRNRSTMKSTANATAPILKCWKRKPRNWRPKTAAVSRITKRPTSGYSRGIISSILPPPIRIIKRYPIVIENVYRERIIACPSFFNREYPNGSVYMLYTPAGSCRTLCRPILRHGGQACFPQIPYHSLGSNSRGSFRILCRHTIRLFQELADADLCCRWGRINRACDHLLRCLAINGKICVRLLSF